MFRFAIPLRGAAIAASITLGWFTAGDAHAAIGATIDESLVSRTLYVDPSNPNATNAGSGSSANPFLSINSAADYAKNLRATQGFGVKVSIAPGTYREYVRLADSTHASSPIVFEAQTPGTVSIRGSDVFDDWTFNGGTGAYTAPWTLPWTTNVDTSPDQVRFDPIGRRQEMVVLDGQRLDQVLDRNQLVPGSFFVDDPGTSSNRRLWVVPPTGVSIGDATVEVAVREDTMDVIRSSNVVVRGLAFEHGGSRLNRSSASFLDSDQLLLEDLVASNNGQTGLGGGRTSNITLNRVVAEDNGLGGLGQSRAVNSVWTNIESRRNNWRGFSGGLTGWFPAGMKVLFLEDAHFENIVMEENLTHGLWFDTENKDISVKNLVSRNNLERGIYIEKNDGPFELTDSRIHDNGDYGIYIAISENVTVTGNTVYDNQEGQLAFVARNAIDADIITGQPIDLGFEGTNIQQNIFASDDATGDADLVRFVVNISDGEGGGEERRVELFNQLTGETSVVDFNEYWHAVDGRHFAGQMGGDQPWDGYRFQFGLDTNSTYTLGDFRSVIPEPVSGVAIGVLLGLPCLARRRRVA